MKNMLRRTLLAGLAAMAPAFATSRRRPHRLWYNDGNEGEVLRDLLDRFEKANPDIKVILDTVPYKAINETLPQPTPSGQAPDIARITDLGGQTEHRSRPRPPARRTAPTGEEIRRPSCPGPVPRATPPASSRCPPR
jgi:alpha-1,4-digalacturonate transport system substrate-binding protein